MRNDSSALGVTKNLGLSVHSALTGVSTSHSGCIETTVALAESAKFSYCSRANFLAQIHSPKKNLATDDTESAHSHWMRGKRTSSRDTKEI